MSRSPSRKRSKRWSRRGRRKLGPLNLGHLLTEGQACQFLLQPLPFGGITALCELVRKRQEALPLGILGFQTLLDKLDQHAVRTRLLCLGQGSYASRHPRRQRDALTDRFLRPCHAYHYTPRCTRMHQMLSEAIKGVDPAPHLTALQLDPPSDFAAPSYADST